MVLDCIKESSGWLLPSRLPNKLRWIHHFSRYRRSDDNDVIPNKNLSTSCCWFVLSSFPSFLVLIARLLMPERVLASSLVVALKTDILIIVSCTPPTSLYFSFVGNCDPQRFIRIFNHSQEKPLSSGTYEVLGDALSQAATQWPRTMLIG